MLFSKPIIQQYRERVFRRYDADSAVFYFSASDFPGLVATPYSFKGNVGQTVKGYFYHYADPIPNKLIVFNHGMGHGGHRAYLREIELLARHGYLVYAYDHTGCMESEGESINGLAQSPADLDFCLNALKADERYRHMEFSVIGHSWGGYACLAIAALHPDLAHIITLSGFRSVKRMQKQVVPAWCFPFCGVMYRLEESNHPRYTHLDAATSLKSTDAHVLIIHSLDDPTVNAKLHYLPLQKELADCKNIRFLTLHGKAHNPNYTDDAVYYKNKVFVPQLLQKRKARELETAEQRAAFIASFDWRRMTEQDATVWKEIFDTLEK